MSHKNPQKILVGMITAYIAPAVFEHTDQADTIEIPGKSRLNILKIAHMDGYIITVTVPVGIDQAALFRQIHTSDAAGLSGQRSGDGPAAAAYLQHLVLG